MTNQEKPELFDRGPSASGDRPSEKARVAVVSAAGASTSSASVQAVPHKMRAHGLTVRYGDKVGVRDVSIDVIDRQVLALIGPSGCGKSTFLRALNRMNDTVPSVSIEGQVELDGEPIYGP